MSAFPARDPRGSSGTTRAVVFPPQGEWTYADYQRLPDDGWRYEIIRGELFMAPAPSPKHQAVIRNLALELGRFLAGRPGGRFYFAPIDLLLPQGLSTPVQPDLVYLAPEHLGLVKAGYIEGAPDLIVEVLSPTNWLVDRRTKFEAYAQAGVAEYWIVDPQKQQVEVYALGATGYELLGQFGGATKAVSKILPGFEPEVAVLLEG